MQRRFVFLWLCASLLLAAPLFAQGQTPSVSVDDQVSLNGTLMINSVYSQSNGWLVIHADNGNGQPGRVVGYAAVAPGWTYNLDVTLMDASLATPTLYAMLHVDDGQVGVYEFDGQSGLDNPVVVNGRILAPGFTVNILRAHDQFIQNDQFVADSVTMPQDGWLVIHSDNNGQPGPVIGEERVLAGTTNKVGVDLPQDGRTEVLWPMLHVDTGTAGVYEFGTVPDADPPVVVRGVVATAPFWTVPHVRVANQIVVKGDGQGAPNSSLQVELVLAEVSGWLVIHVDNGSGQPGPVAGYAAVPAGLSTNIRVDGLDTSKLTPVLWPMLHVDTGTPGEYEFGTVPGADSPVMVDGQVLTFPINAAPSLVLKAQDPLPGESTGTIRFVVDEALIDAPGWLAIHANNNGQPGPVIGTALLHTGSNQHLIVEVDQAQADDVVFPMLHYDTGTVGAYEFGSVPDADPPVSVNGQVVVAPLPLSAATPTPTETATATLIPTNTPAPTVQPPAATEELPIVVTAEPPLPTEEAPIVVTAEPPLPTVTEEAPVEGTAVPVMPTASEPPMSVTCTITSYGAVNRRTGPGTNFSRTGIMTYGQSAPATAQTIGTDGYLWYQLDDGTFVRSDVVAATGDCASLPQVSGEQPAPPVATPETVG